jgi:hypothetical protein
VVLDAAAAAVHTMLMISNLPDSGAPAAALAARWSSWRHYNTHSSRRLHNISRPLTAVHDNVSAACQTTADGGAFGSSVLQPHPLQGRIRILLPRMPVARCLLQPAVSLDASAAAVPAHMVLAPYDSGCTELLQPPLRVYTLTCAAATPQGLVVGNQPAWLSVS